MPSRIIALLDEDLVRRFCGGSPSEHHASEQELKHRLETMLEKQAGDTEFSIEGASLVGGRQGVADLKLSASGLLAIRELTKIDGKGARVVQIEFASNRFHTLVEVSGCVFHVSMQNGETTKALLP